MEVNTKDPKEWSLDNYLNIKEGVNYATLGEVFTKGTEYSSLFTCLWSSPGSRHWHILSWQPVPCWSSLPSPRYRPQDTSCHFLPTSSQTKLQRSWLRSLSSLLGLPLFLGSFSARPPPPVHSPRPPSTRVPQNNPLSVLSIGLYVSFQHDCDYKGAHRHHSLVWSRCWQFCVPSKVRHF